MNNDRTREADMQSPWTSRSRLEGLVLLAVMFLGAAADLLPQAARPDRAEEIVRRVDGLYRSGTSEATVEMEVVTPNWQRTLRMKVWSRGMSDTFIRVLEPKKESGFATLRLGNEMWNYLPKTAKVLRVPPSMMMSSWMGSDLTNDDLVKEFTFVESYHFEMIVPESPEPGIVYIKCVPKEGLPIVWGSVVLAVREDDLLPVWERFYDEKGGLARTIAFRDVRTFGRRRIPSTMELVPEAKAGHKTVLRYLEAVFDLPLAAGIFSLRNLHGDG
jgi:outer membrane lipoprotein-sorting protein